MSPSSPRVSEDGKKRKRTSSSPPARSSLEQIPGQVSRDSTLAQPGATSLLAQNSDILTKWKTGGVYIPPARLRQLQKRIEDKSSPAYQRLAWEALKKKLNGLVNKVNTNNLKSIVVELFRENLLRGRGLLARSLMKAQAAALPFTPVYAAMIAVLNTKLPEIGDLILARVVAGFRKAYKRNDKTACLATVNFIAQMVNHQIAHEIVALQIMALLLERATDDSVEIAVSLCKAVGAYLTDVSGKSIMAIFELFRNVLQEGRIHKRVQYMIEVLFEIRKEKFKDFPIKTEELDLVEEEDQNTHYVSLDDDLDVHESLNVFKADPDYAENEAKYKALRREILDEASEDENSGDEADEESDDIPSEEDDSHQAEKYETMQKRMEIEDMTNQDRANLRRQIYLTIQSSLSAEECVHKLIRMYLRDGQELELTRMVIECSAQEKLYMKFYGSIAETFCKLYPRRWVPTYLEQFQEVYDTVHRFETNRIRNMAKLFAHLLSADALPWRMLKCVRLTEEDTTSSSRIFVKILFQDLAEAMSLQQLSSNLHDPNAGMPFSAQAGTRSGKFQPDETLDEVYGGLFPKDHPKHTRFAINYWTSIGLGALTEELRDWLKSAPKTVLSESESSSELSSSSSELSTSSSDVSSDTEESESSDSEREERLRQRTRLERHTSAERPRRHSPSESRSASQRTGRDSEPSSYAENSHYHQQDRRNGRDISPSPHRRQLSPATHEYDRSSASTHRRASPSLVHPDRRHVVRQRPHSPDSERLSPPPPRRRR